MNKLQTIVLLVGVVAIAHAEVIPFENCKESVKCTVHEVRVDPCPEVAQNKPCVMLRGSNATIAFDYTPEFDAQVATAKAFWTAAIDLPFAGLDNEACKYTPCPVVAGQKQSYSYDLPILKSYPTRRYKVKWQLLNEANEMCCFLIDMEIKKGRKH
ncbi:MD-2-related lipid-recognition protein-like [Armigeres subalbatus]|uniref:MD-2-related lipid-recognition protein-like n=1 Tax=Armigeres subalbatus TaxID=124917 RepID=UPI002ED1B9AC